MPQHPPNRVGFYVDGFNLYYGLRDSGLRKFLWLDIPKLASLMLLPHQSLNYTKYFTARISGGKPSDKAAYRAARDGKRKRQADYLDALSSATLVEIFEGRFLEKTVACNKCHATWSDAEEKMTDVNIATELLVDSFADRFDAAIVVSADSDLVPPVRAIRRYFPFKRIVAAFPPSRFSVDLKKAATGYVAIAKSNPRKSQLPDEVIAKNGFKIKRPAGWI